jgi:cysteine synthase A
MRKVQSVEELVGRTPLLRLNRLFPSHTVYAKLELFNPLSIKDRAVMSMIAGGLRRGHIGPDTEVVEASSGNTAIAIALLGAVMGFKVRIYMSELASVERRQILCAYGARVVVTSGEEHTRGARERAIRYCRENPERAFFLNQHSNADNGRAHYTTTGPELWEQTGGKLDVMVIGLGTSGTFDGLSTYLKEKDPTIRIVGFEPRSSPVYSGGAPGKHALIGIGPGFVTDNFERSRQNMDEMVLVPDQAAFDMTREIARVEGLLVGPTSGAGAWVCSRLVEREEMRDRTLVCIFCDTGERYLSTPGLFPADNLEFQE